MKRILLVTSVAIALVGCGSGSDDKRGERERSSPSKDRSGPTEASEQFGYMPQGFEVIDFEDEPRGRPPGLSASLVNQQDCCKGEDEGAELTYPPTVLVRKYSVEGTTLENAEFKRGQLAAIPGYEASSYRQSVWKLRGQSWVRTSYDINLPEEDMPALRTTVLSTVDGGTMRELSWVSASVDSDLLEQDLLRMARQVRWDAVDTVEFA